jgi:hypothetical protein
MIGRALLLFLIAVILTAFFVPRADAHELPCFDEETSRIWQPPEYVKGYGATSEGIVKLSVTSEGAFMLSFSPPSLDGGICIVWLGEGWEWVVPKREKREAQRDDS